MAAGGGRRAILAAMGANAGIAVAKFVAFLVTRSASMLAESIHSLADTSNQGLLLLGGARAQRRATSIHQFGYGRERYFWSFVVALILFSLGGLFAIFEGIEKIRDPHELSSIGWAIGVLVLAIALEGYSFRTADARGPAAEGRPQLGRVHPQGPDPRAAGRAARGHRRPARPGLRTGGRGAGVGDRQRAVGRRGHAGHRRAAGRHRPGADHRDEEPADRRSRHRGRPPAPRRGAGGHRRRAAGDPPAHPAPRPAGPAGRREDRAGGRPDRGRASRTSSTRPRPPCARPCRRHASSTSSPTCTTRRRPRPPTLLSSRAVPVAWDRAATPWRP